MAGVSPPNFPEYRLTDDASPLTGALVGTSVLIAIAVAIRLVMAGLIDDPVHPVTYAGLVGGFLGAVAMALGMQVMRVRANLATTDFLTKTFGDRFEDPGSYVYGGTALHLVYGGIAGSFYPRIIKGRFGLHGSEFVAFPASMLYRCCSVSCCSCSGPSTRRPAWSTWTWTPLNRRIAATSSCRWCTP